MRDLVATRLSHYTDASTSIERQGEAGHARSKSDGGTVIAVTEDVDVSGAISPLDRAELGPWLTEPAKIAQWDRLIVTKLDRLSRSLIDLDRVVKWCQANNKTLVSIGESIDMSTAAGRMFVMLLGIFAQFERERMSERRAEAQEKIRQLGQWGGGRKSFARQPVKTATGGWEELPVADMVPTLYRMAEMVFNGDSAAKIGRWLDEEHVPTAQGGTKWRSSSVLAVLRNPSLAGYVVRTGPSGARFAEPEIVVDSDLNPVRRSEEIFDPETWRRLQAALDVARRPHTVPRSAGHWLLGLATCQKCGAQFWSSPSINKRRNPPVEVRYYACSNSRDHKCNAGGIPTTDLDARVLAEIQAEYANTLYPEKQEPEPGVDNSDRITGLDELIARLDTAHDNGQIIDETYYRRITDLDKRRLKLIEEETEPGPPEYKFAADTISERFTKADLDGRRAIMLDLDISLVDSGADGAGY